MEEPVAKESPGGSFHEEISSMMHGFGDSLTPDTDTVRLVENMVKKQIREMLNEITLKSTERNFKMIKAEDIIFYLKHNKQKIQRIFKYITFKYIDANRKINDPLVIPEKKIANSKSLLKAVKNFIKIIDETGELSDTSAFDAAKHSRNLRAERISASLDEEKYLEYARARCQSFNHGRRTSYPNCITRLNKWIDPQNDFNLHKEALEIISFLSYGIVANVTDMALIIRENNAYVASDPLQMKIGHYHNSMMFNVPHLSKNNTLHVNKGQPAITVNEIYEVIRRCYMPQVGYMKFSNKSILGKRKLFY